MIHSREEFSIHLDFTKDSKKPERVFQSMTSLTLAMKHLDELLAASVSRRIESHILLQDIESGSIFSKFRTILENIDDADLRDLNVKRMVGKFLVKGKHEIIDYIDKKESLTQIQDVTTLISNIENIKDKLLIETTLTSIPISHSNLLYILKEISDSLMYLEIDDSVELVSDEATTVFSKSFVLTDEKIESLLTGKTDIKKNTLLLKIKKPDYLGTSKWIFKSRYGQMDIKILDQEWLRDFQTAKQIILPGDSIKAIIETTIEYDHQGNERNINHFLIKVLDIVQGYSDTDLELPY